MRETAFLKCETGHSILHNYFQILSNSSLSLIQHSPTVVSYQNEFFIKMRAALLAPILPRVLKEGESQKADLILMKNCHFDRTLRCRVT